MTPASLVRFSDVLDYDEDDAGRSGLDTGSVDESPSAVEQHQTEDIDDHVPGSVEVGRGKGKSRDRSRSRLTRSSRRKYDSGIGMDGDDDEEADLVMAELKNTGMMTPDMSSDAEFAG